MREIYKTEGIILSNFRAREVDKDFLVLSPDLGLCFMRAGGVRNIKSKLRFSLQDLSLVDLDLVRGRAGWRITNAGLKKNWYVGIKGDKIFLQKISEIKNLLFRMTDGDFELGKIFELFTEVFDFYEGLGEGVRDKKIRDGLEMVLLSRILFGLGYIDGGKWAEGVLEGEKVDIGLIEKVLNNKKFIYEEINRAINESQL